MKSFFRNRLFQTVGAIAALLLASSHGVAAIIGPGQPLLANSTNPSDFGQTVPIEIVSMNLVSAQPLQVSPPGGGSFQVDSFFDIFVDLSGAPDGSTFLVDSFFDIFVELEVDGHSGPVIDSFFDIDYQIELTVGGQPGAVRPIEVEMVALSLVGLGPENAQLRLLPQLPSLHQTELIQLPGGNFQVDSFFDVFFEVSIDGGNSWVPSQSPMGFSLVPVPIAAPPTLLLLGMGACLAGIPLRLTYRRL